MWMAEGKTYGCDTNSSRCTQLLTDTRLAVEHNRMAAYGQRKHGIFAQGEQELGAKSFEFRHRSESTRGDVLPMGLSPSPTDVDVCSNHGMHVLAH